jgi:hypothetical protein
MDLFYDPRDRFHEKRGSKILYWLDDLGAKPFNEAGPSAEGFLFAGARPVTPGTLSCVTSRNLAVMRPVAKVVVKRYGIRSWQAGRIGQDVHPNVGDVIVSQVKIREPAQVRRASQRQHSRVSDLVAAKYQPGESAQVRR